MDPREIRYEIEELLHAYARCIDEDRLEEWPEFFTEECVYKVIPVENAAAQLPIAIMYGEGRGMLQDRVMAHRKANLFAPHLYRHLIGNTQVTGREGDAIVASSNYAVFQTLMDPANFGESRIYSVGVYRDRVVFEDRKARFKEKIVLTDTSRIQTLLVTPI